MLMDVHCTVDGGADKDPTVDSFDLQLVFMKLRILFRQVLRQLLELEGVEILILNFVTFL